MGNYFQSNLPITRVFLVFASKMIKNKTLKSLAIKMVTTYGVLHGLHSGVVQNEVLMDDLFNSDV